MRFDDTKPQVSFCVKFYALIYIGISVNLQINNRLAIHLNPLTFCYV